MPLEFMGRAPYTPSTTVLAIIAQHRRTPIAKFDANVLDRQVNIASSLIPRTLVALQLLGFSDENGNATPEFTELARVSESQLKGAVADILRTAYEPVLKALGGDPATATPEDISAAFRSYNPLGQLERMVQLFTGLMVYVGMMPEAGTRRRKGADASTPRGTRAPATPKVKEDKKKDADAVDAPIREAKLSDKGAGVEAPAYSLSVTLEGGAGEMTLSGTVNPFALKGASRDFVFALIDLMGSYKEKVSGEQVAHGSSVEVKP